MKKWWWLALLAVVYLLCLRAYYVGFFNDDAFYVMGARSLLQGRYAELSSPLPRPLDNYPPGYPLLLAQSLWLFGGSLLAGQLLSVLLSLGSAYLVWRLSGGEWRAALAAGLSPLTASLSGTLLSEPAYAALTLLTLFAARRNWDRADDRVWAFLGALSGYAALIRATGFVLPATLVLCLALERRARAAVLAGLMSAAVSVPYYARNLLSTGRAETRLSELLDAGLRAPWSNALFYGHELGNALFRGAPVLILAALAYAVLRRERLLSTYLGLYALLHLAWPYQAARYVYPVLGLLCLFQPRWLLALSVALSVLPTWRVIRASTGGRTPMNTPPEKAYAFIRETTDRSDVLAADLDGRLWLWTDRKVAHLPRQGDLDSFLYAENVSYVFIEPTGMMLRRGDSFDHPDAEQRAAELTRHELVFFDETEGTRVYRTLFSKDRASDSRSRE